MDLNDLNQKTTEQLRKLNEALEALSYQNKWHKLSTIFPDKGPLRRELYTQALEFLRKGKEKRFRVYMGGNRSGKSYTCAAEVAYHLTGEYPYWWEGRSFKKIKTVWIIAESYELWRDSAQRLLFGDAGEETGTGLLPLAEKNNDVGLVNWASKQGSPGCIASAVIKHKNGHHVSLIVKTNEMARENFQAAKVDLVWFDEEPREDIYTECLMRLMGAGKDKEPGIAILAFTPLKGLSDVVLRFCPGGVIPESGATLETPERYVCRVEWDNVPHLSKEDKEIMLQEIPEHLRDTRTKGIPTLGSGRIYPVSESVVAVIPFQIPDYWPRAYALDFGWNCTAALWGAKDPNTDCIYLYAEYYVGQQIPSIHAHAIKSKGSWIKGINDPAGGGRDSNGKMVVDLYRSLGLDLTDGENSFEAGVARVLEAFETGRLKIFNNLLYFIQELRLYRYDTKDPNKPARNQKDHLMDCVKYLLSRFDDVAISKAESEELEDEDYISSRSNRDSLTGY